MRRAAGRLLGSVLSTHYQTTPISAPARSCAPTVPSRVPPAVVVVRRSCRTRRRLGGAPAGFDIGRSICPAVSTRAQIRAGVAWVIDCQAIHTRTCERRSLLEPSAEYGPRSGRTSCGDRVAMTMYDVDGRYLSPSASLLGLRDARPRRYEPATVPRVTVRLLAGCARTPVMLRIVAGSMPATSP